MTTKKGLEGIVATESSISSIIDDQLTYVGYRIDDLAENASFEEVIYLLWNQKLPTQAELDELKADLASNMKVPDEMIEHLRSYDLSNVHPMAALRSRSEEHTSELQSRGHIVCRLLLDKKNK